MKRTLGNEVREVMEIRQGPIGHCMPFSPRKMGCLRVFKERNYMISGRCIKNKLWRVWEKQGNQLRGNGSNPGKSYWLPGPEW